jgi:hypothetical protein
MISPKPTKKLTQKVWFRYFCRSMLFPKHTWKTITLITAISEFQSGRVIEFDGLYKTVQGRRASEEAI